MESSFLMDVGITNGNLNKTNYLLDEFKFGHRGNVSEDHMKSVKQIQDYVNWWNNAGSSGLASSTFSWLSFSQLSSQKCEDLFVSLSFRGL